jgi:hypothetical protein
VDCKRNLRKILTVLDLGHLPGGTQTNIQEFIGDASAVGVGWKTWTKPRGASMVYIFGLGQGGGGGEAVAGAASTAAGGGGGGSGGQTSLLIPAYLLPDTLYISAGKGNPSNTSTSAAASFSTYVAVHPGNNAAPTANNTVLIANGGASGGKSAGATAGPVGTAGAIATIATMPLAGLGTYTLTAGQVGIIGGTTGNGAALTVPVTGLVVTGGSGGGGLPAISTAGGNGGGITGGGVIPSVTAASGGTTAPTGGANGVEGTRPFKGMGYWMGGTGGGASGTSAGSGSTGGNGGNGSIGSGGGGGGGAFTAFAFGVGGRGGPGYVLIASW